jgi:hypothetical protein
MIIWSGLGLLVFVFAFGCSLGMNLLTNAVFKDESYYITHRWPLCVALLIAGTLSWLLGRHLDSKQGRILVDKATGREVLVKANHSLFFIKVHY